MENVSLDKASIIAFLQRHGVVNEKGDALTFEQRLFLYDIYCDWSPNQVIKKCAQIGMSTAAIVKTLFAPKSFGWNIIYTLPTDDDVREFVGTKTNKIIQANPSAFEGLQTDNIERKEIGDRFLHYKGTVSKTAAIMTTADLLVHDETDRSDMVQIEKYRSRLKASNYKGVWQFSNPSVEKAGVDLLWQQSDQKEWEVNCQVCERWQILTWPDSIDLKTAQYRCVHCGAPMSDEVRAIGRWTPQQQGKDVSGYHISLLMAPWIKAKEIIKESEGDPEYFFNFILGEPWSPGDMRVARHTILDCWTPKSLETGRWYLGVDVGNVKHYTLGSEKGVTKVGTFSDWHFLDDLLTRYKPVCVIDANPENTMALHYVKTYQNVFMSYFKRDRDRKKLVEWGEGDNRGVVFSDRNRIIDTVINQLLNAKILYGLQSDRDFREYVKHWETLRRIKVTNNIGIERYEWESTTGVDHYVFATVYYYLATLASGHGAVLSLPTQADKPGLMVQTSEGLKLRSLKEMMADDQLYG